MERRDFLDYHYVDLLKFARENVEENSSKSFGDYTKSVENIKTGPSSYKTVFHSDPLRVDGTAGGRVEDTQEEFDEQNASVIK